MHKPLFVVTTCNVNDTDRYIPNEDDVWNEVKNIYDCIDPDGGWTKDHFADALKEMFGTSVTCDGSVFTVPQKAVKEYLYRMAVKIRTYIIEKPLTAGTICGWKNGLMYGLFEEGSHFIVDGASEYSIDFASGLLASRNNDKNVTFRLEAVYDVHF